MHKRAWEGLLKGRPKVGIPFRWGRGEAPTGPGAFTGLLPKKREKNRRQKKSKKKKKLPFYLLVKR